MLLIAILCPFLCAAVLTPLRLGRRPRRLATGAALLLTDALGVAAALWGKPISLFELTERVPLAFAPDDLGRFFLLLVLCLYTLAGFYAFEYLEHDRREGQFYLFWLLSEGAMLAACMAGNLVSLYLCFELATLTSMPLVLHERSRESVNAALKYLFYSIGGALLGLFAVIVLCLYGSGEFVYGGFLAPAAVAAHPELLRFAVFAGIVGFGAKAGLYPLHGWLPTAHPVAPAPASALLSGLIAKAGILAVTRLVYWSAGPALLRSSWVQSAWMTLAALTVLMGSTMAWREKVVKKRLAYSTVSQLSYIMLGLSLLNPAGLAGALVHVAGHACAKGTLFLCAGVFIHKLDLRRADELKGVGARMPVTMFCFTAASLSLVGIPPFAGFASKWRIASEALNAAPGPFRLGIPIVLLISALLTAGYLLPVVVDAFFPPKTEHEDAESADLTPAGESHSIEKPESAEPSALMTLPMALLSLGALLVGVFSGRF